MVSEASFSFGTKKRAPAGGADRRVGERDLLDRARRVRDLDLVAEAQRLGEGDEDPGDEVRERRARGHPEDEREDGGGREQAAGDRADLRDDEERAQDAERDDDRR